MEQKKILMFIIKMVAVIIGTIFVGLVVFRYEIIKSIYPLASEQEMIEHYMDNKEEFNQLLDTMGESNEIGIQGIQDSKNSLFTIFPKLKPHKTNSHIILSEEPSTEVDKQSLIKQNLDELKAINSIAWIREEEKSFTIHPRNYHQNKSYYYVYSQIPIENQNRLYLVDSIENSLNDPLFKRVLMGNSFVVIRQIEDNWYLAYGQD
jgi:hypothetical protein